MTTMTKMMVCGVMAAATILIPARLKAQSDDDKKFLAMAAQGDQDEIALSKAAEAKASNPAVKAFAEKMVAEHTKITQMMKPYAEQWGVMAPSGPDSDHQKELDKLNGLSGKDFDKEYIDQMVSDHTKALDAYTKEANDTQDAKFKATVVQAKTMVAAHKNMAYDLKKKL